MLGKLVKAIAQCKLRAADSLDGDIQDQEKYVKNMTKLGKEQPSVRTKQILELVSFLTHEFKTPLTSIRASAGLLAEELALAPDDPKTRLINNILISTHNLEARASELLELAQLEAEGFQLEYGLIDIGTIVYNVVDQLSPVVSSRDQSLTLDLGPQFPQIMADHLRIEQILLNLLSNATKFTPRGGNISLKVNRQNNHITIEVQDSGPTIPPEEQHKVFLPYYRLKIDKEHAPGIGLGLSLCKHLTELHGGKIWVESKQSEGNIFCLLLPLEKPIN